MSPGRNDQAHTLKRLPLFLLASASIVDIVKECQQRVLSSPVTICQNKTIRRLLSQCKAINVVHLPLFQRRLYLLVILIFRDVTFKSPNTNIFFHLEIVESPSMLSTSKNLQKFSIKIMGKNRNTSFGYAFVILKTWVANVQKINI
eukprot:gene2998-5876_t